jgi:hypothetical protein
VLRERDETESRHGVPHFDLAVLSTSDKQLAIWRIGKRVDVILMALLLENV